jgi:hypothetical protein
MSAHGLIEADYIPFERDGRVLLQIDTYGSAVRQNPGKQSQTIQLDRESASQLYIILRDEFGFD